MEHTLADEMTAWAPDVIRACKLVERACAALDEPHPALVPENILVDDAGGVRLVATAPPAVPYRAPEPAVTFASNVYSLAMIARAMFRGRAPGLHLGLEPAVRAEPAMRPSIAELRTTLGHGWMRDDAGLWHPPFAPDETERALVAAMNEEGGRSVYADWLEQQGAVDRAGYLRSGTPAAPGDARWRAVLGEARIDCFSPGCPKQWSALARTAQDNLRTCATCTRTVHYCTSIATIENETRRGVPIAIDAGLAAAQVQQTLAILHSPMYGQSPANPPLPRSYSQGAPGGGVLTRLFGLFRRR